jgi:hypothetical protein
MSGVDQGPPPRYGTRKNPKTGAMETYRLPDPVDLEKARRELGEVLHGSGWFDDPMSKPVPPEPDPVPYCGTPDTWGRAIEAIRQGR